MTMASREKRRLEGITQFNGGSLIAKMLKQEGVEYVFGLSGGHVDPIFQGCLDEGIGVIDTRHEQAAVFMADGWARVTGKPGVAVVTAGPGVTNAISGLWTAQATGSPIVVFGGRSPLGEFEQGSMQDIDSLPLVKTVTKWARAGYETKRIAEYVSMAFRHALCGRPGPVYLEVPIDVLRAKIDETEVVLPRNYRTTARLQGDPDLVKAAVELLLRAKKPIIIAGSGVWWSQAAKELLEFIELTKIPLSSGLDRIPGYIPADHPLCLPMIGKQDADVVLLLGARLDFRLWYGRSPMFNKNSKWIQVDIEPTEIGRNRPIDIGITGDAKAVLSQMIEEVRARCRNRSELPWVKECRERLKVMLGQLETAMNSNSVPVHPARLCREIRDFIDKDATVVVDGGDISFFVFFTIWGHQPGHLLGTLPTRTLGVGPSFAMAAKLARPSTQVILISGDGSFGLNGMEFNTMVRHNLPVVCVISNDCAWGMVMHEQQAIGPDRVVGTQLGFTRYDKVVEALGGYGEMVEKPADIRPALQRAFESGKPACINVRCLSAALEGISLG
jgi:acetolactate synthase-1/2/3 large subunit